VTEDSPGAVDAVQEREGCSDANCFSAASGYFGDGLSEYSFFWAFWIFRDPVSEASLSVAECDAIS
jgi:hypothetical protein